MGLTNDHNAFGLAMPKFLKITQYNALCKIADILQNRINIVNL